MGLSRGWTVESKDFEMLVKDGSTGLKIKERSKGLLRFVHLDSKESTWLLNIFDELMAVKDSRVFRDQSVKGYLRILAQHCFNRYGDFLAIEEYEGRARWGSVLILEGRLRKGWDRFASELRIAINFFQPFLAGPKLATVKKKRSFIEVLMSSVRSMEEVFNPSSMPIARVLKWLAGAADNPMKKSVFPATASRFPVIPSTLAKKSATPMMSFSKVSSPPVTFLHPMATTSPFLAQSFSIGSGSPPPTKSAP
jgi:hypothetical protein